MNETEIEKSFTFLQQVALEICLVGIVKVMMTVIRIQL